MSIYFERECIIEPEALLRLAKVTLNEYLDDFKNADFENFGYLEYLAHNIKEQAKYVCDIQQEINNNLQQL
jgi:hypothetical protein